MDCTFSCHCILEASDLTHWIEMNTVSMSWITIFSCSVAHFHHVLFLLSKSDFDFSANQKQAAWRAGASTPNSSNTCLARCNRLSSYWTQWETQSDRVTGSRESPHYAIWNSLHQQSRVKPENMQRGEVLTLLAIQPPGQAVEQKRGNCLWLLSFFIFSHD